MSVRTSIIEFLDLKVAEAEPSSALANIEVNDNPAQLLIGLRGVTVMWPAFDLAPKNGELREYGGDIDLICYAMVSGDDKTQRSAAYDAADDLAKAVATLFFNDPTINGAVCDARIMRGEGGWDAEDGQPYLLIGLSLRYNEIGPVSVG